MTTGISPPGLHNPPGDMVRHRPGAIPSGERLTTDGSLSPIHIDSDRYNRPADTYRASTRPRVVEVWSITLSQDGVHMHNSGRKPPLMGKVTASALIPDSAIKAYLCRHRKITIAGGRESRRQSMGIHKRTVTIDRDPFGVLNQHIRMAGAGAPGSLPGNL
ncbi:MAG: hypothetical protein ABW168_16885 [Sedimenticola sp.]